LDTLTHIVLGACTGEAIAGRQLGKRALLIGGFVNTIPDFDVVSQLWLPTDQGLLAHRGFTHSFLFAMLAAIFLAMLFKRWYKEGTMRFRFWFLFFVFELFLHLFIDGFNAYGTGWFEPFSHYRVSFQTIFVVDPFYTVWLAIAFIPLLLLPKYSTARETWIRFGIGISTLYFMYCIVNKIKTDTDIKDILQKQHIAYKNYFTTPTPLNNWLWYIVAGDDSGYFIGYYSVFDNKKNIDLHYFPKNNLLLEPVKNQKEVSNLVRFSRGFYTVENWNDTLVFNDLRFGQMIGWYNPEEKFVFHYFLQRNKENKLVVQRGRFANWNIQVIKSLIKRIEGN
jgi:inner membrane protein